MNIMSNKDASKCKDCGKCRTVCPRYFIPDYGEKNAECQYCYQCYAACPEHAIRSMHESVCAPDKDNVLTKTIIERRSHRKYLNKEVGKDIIQELINFACYIPSGGNAHSYQFTVIMNPDVIRKLKNIITTEYLRLSKLLKNKIIRNIVKHFTDKTTKAFINSEKYFKRVLPLIQGLKSDKDLIFYNAPVVIAIHSKDLVPTPAIDSMLAAYNITLKAEQMGLGTCIVSLSRQMMNQSTKCKELIGIDKKDNIYSVLVLGYPKVKYFRPVLKKTSKPIYV